MRYAGARLAAGRALARADRARRDADFSRPRRRARPISRSMPAAPTCNGPTPPPSRSTRAAWRRCCPAGEAAILAEARSLIDWHARHRLLRAMRLADPGRRPPAGCGAARNARPRHYPRSDPVTIMLAVRGEYGAPRPQPAAPRRRFSCLAGFMEPGETLEEAVRREVHEESGIRVGRVRYLACQPWPFPSSLMMGFLCEGAHRGDHRRPGGAGRGALVPPRRNPRDGGARRQRPRRPDPGLVAGAGRDRAPYLPPLVERARRAFSTHANTTGSRTAEGEHHMRRTSALCCSRPLTRHAPRRRN